MEDEWNLLAKKYHQMKLFCDNNEKSCEEKRTINVYFKYICTYIKGFFHLKEKKLEVNTKNCSLKKPSKNHHVQV